ncbi:hypothetical protein M0802_005862 [Mischocyttarus mexicanus]|nr:hypothetical protein M0802_005862 [Mischocyttarus mexicanus]
MRKGDYAFDGMKHVQALLKANLETECRIREWERGWETECGYVVKGLSLTKASGSGGGGGGVVGENHTRKEEMKIPFAVLKPIVKTSRKSCLLILLSFRIERDCGGEEEEVVVVVVVVEKMEKNEEEKEEKEDEEKRHGGCCNSMACLEEG